MTILTLGMELAKDVFAVHGVNETGKARVEMPMHDNILTIDKRGVSIAALGESTTTGLASHRFDELRPLDEGLRVAEAV